jgi:hypothetical protein
MTAVADNHLVGAAGDPVQRTQALIRANEVRLARTRIRRELKTGQRDYATLLLDPPDFAETMPISQVVKALPHIGRHKTTTILNRLGMSTFVTIRDLSMPRRRELIEMLDEWPR